ncbi:SET domain-containing protein 4 isoform X1 [Corythoichthys intestinalis]|uniref:SET domain-containing protein 4 isoform X1 n=1 Tax=Corythoichthys intestinalis TaxID=161448 RepID=UPI0025A639B3|nr:SET domain-containing protein 4 isoform X1 [Corythoichthys intestinalis]
MTLLFSPGIIMGRRGRASRKRTKKRDGTLQSVSLSHQPEYVALLRFVHQRGFTSKLLKPAFFSDTGRGLQAFKSVKPNQLLVSLPESCLLTTSTVLDSYLGHYMKRSWQPRISPLLALCVFLVCERHRGPDADWSPYIHILPASYTCPAYFADDVTSLLPVGLRRRAIQQKDAVREIHSSNQDFFRTLQPILSQPVEDVMTFEALRWAWCSVNTRSVFMRQPSNKFLCGEDDYALAPFLDLLNHRPDVQVKAGFNHETKCYEIRSVCGTARFQQAFINYGPHDNQSLLMEYGFVASGNPHSLVYVDTEILCEVVNGNTTNLEQRMKFLTDNNFLNNLSISGEGPNWRLMTTLRLMSPQTLFYQWKAVLLGQMVGKEVERWSIRMAVALSQKLLQDTLTILDTISRHLQQGEPSLKQQLHVVESLLQEEKCILGRCLSSLRSAQVEATKIDENNAS